MQPRWCSLASQLRQQHPAGWRAAAAMSFATPPTSSPGGAAWQRVSCWTPSWMPPLDGNGHHRSMELGDDHQQDDSAAQPANALRIDVPKAATPTTISSTTSSSILGPTRPAAGSSASRSSPDGSCGREQTCAHGCVLRTHRPGTKWDRIAQAPRAETGTAGCPRRCAHELGPRRRAGVGLLQQSSIQDAVFHHRCQTTLVLQNGYIAGGVAVDQDQVGGCPLFQRTHHPGRVVGLAAVPGSAEQGLNWRHAEQVHVVLEVLCVGAMRGDAEAIVAADK
ncbi:hypothetical protein GQR58_030499 [Nymphon striatum]|nr:hypothetical protein GQR58_030499 [Nymphon striatum]